MVFFVLFSNLSYSMYIQVLYKSCATSGVGLSGTVQTDATLYALCHIRKSYGSSQYPFWLQYNVNIPGSSTDILIDIYIGLNLVNCHNTDYTRTLVREHFIKTLASTLDIQEGGGMASFNFYRVHECIY